MPQDKATQRRDDRTQPGRDQDQDRDRAQNQQGAMTPQGADAQGRQPASQDPRHGGGYIKREPEGSNANQPGGQMTGSQNKPASPAQNTDEDDWAGQQPHEKNETKQGGSDCGCG